MYLCNTQKGKWQVQNKIFNSSGQQIQATSCSKIQSFLKFRKGLFATTDGRITHDDGLHNPIGQERKPLSLDPDGFLKIMKRDGVYGQCLPGAGRRPGDRDAFGVWFFVDKAYRMTYRP
jgi:hypothetical protein